MHVNNQRDGALWDGDGLQIGVAPEPYLPAGSYCELGVALAGGSVQRWAWRALPGQPTGELSFPCAIVRAEGETRYEMAIPRSMLGPIRLAPGAVIGLGLCVNEQDSAGRGYYGWHAGIASDKDRALFGQVTLSR